MKIHNKTLSHATRKKVFMGKIANKREKKEKIFKAHLEVKSP